MKKADTQRLSRSLILSPIKFLMDRVGGKNHRKYKMNSRSIQLMFINSSGQFQIDYPSTTRQRNISLWSLLKSWFAEKDSKNNKKMMNCLKKEEKMFFKSAISVTS
jgi:hypothetical protein